MFACVYVSFKYKWLINLNYTSTSVYVFIGLGKTLKPDILERTRAHLNYQTVSWIRVQFPLEWDFLDVSLTSCRLE